jgi:hypothetical protein
MMARGARRSPCRGLGAIGLLWLPALGLEPPADASIADPFTELAATAAGPSDPKPIPPAPVPRPPGTPIPPAPNPPP